MGREHIKLFLSEEVHMTCGSGAMTHGKRESVGGGCAPPTQRKKPKLHHSTCSKAFGELFYIITSK